MKGTELSVQSTLSALLALLWVPPSFQRCTQHPLPADSFAAASPPSVVLGMKIPAGLSVLICKMGTITASSQDFGMNGCFKNYTRAC